MNHAKLEQLAPEIERQLEISEYKSNRILAAKLRAAISEQPEGKVVPVEPTEDMRLAGCNTIQEHYSRDGGWCGLAAAQEQMMLTWNAMLAAAPNNAETTQGHEKSSVRPDATMNVVGPSSVSAPNVLAAQERQARGDGLPGDAIVAHPETNAAAPERRKIMRRDTSNPDTPCLLRRIHCGDRRQNAAVQAAPSKLPLNKSNIEWLRKSTGQFHHAHQDAICDQALAALDLKQQVAKLKADLRGMTRSRDFEQQLADKAEHELAELKARLK